MKRFLFGQFSRQGGRARGTGLAAFLTAVLMVMLAGATAAKAEDSQYAGEVPVYWGVKTIGVSIGGSMAPLMTRMFGLHGAFHVVTAGGDADYGLRFDAAGDNGVTVTATPKKNGTAFSQTVTGASQIEAAYRAGDLVVQKLTNTPGFFAGKLAFVSKRSGSRQIYVSDMLGQQILRMTTDRNDLADPHWSPNGRYILYTGYLTGFMGIYRIDVATMERKTFAEYKGLDTGAVYSPDGSHVAMILSSNDQPQLFVSNAEGGDLVKVTNTTSAKSSPTWSPDGAYIALSCDPRGSPLLYTAPATGRALRMLSPVSIRGQTITYCTEAAWNPVDPSLLVFSAGGGGSPQLVLYSFKTHEAKLLGAGREACWANDGRHVIYTSVAGSTGHLAIFDTQTGHSAPLTSKDAFQPTFVYTK